MDIVIKIPKEFEKDFNEDRFEESIQRIRYDIKKAFLRKESLLSGNYELETLDMLTDALINAAPLPKDHGRLIDVNQIVYEKDCIWESDGCCTTVSTPDIDTTPTIIEAEEDGKDEVGHD